MRKSNYLQTLTITHNSPLAIDDKVEIRKVLPLSLAFDHRTFDDAEAALFVKTVKDQLEAPENL